MKNILPMSSMIGLVLLIESAAAIELTNSFLDREVIRDQYLLTENRENVAKTDTNVEVKEKGFFSDLDIYFSYENYTPADRNEYTYQGVNIELQKTFTYNESQFEMFMGPNVSLLTDEYENNEEEMVFLKWDHGLLHNFDLGQNYLLQPLAQIGVGYGWVKSEKNQQSPTFELLAGLNFKPNKSYNIYAKSGYRYFELNNDGQKSLGDLKGGFAMIGFGMPI
jgi:opacity protein-like surface antigen